MFSLFKVILSVTVLSSVVFGLPLTDDNISDGQEPDIFSFPLINSNRIFGGQEAAIGQFPYQISLRAGRSTVFQHICGGSIITNRFVLTAGHCVPRGNLARYRVAAGAHKSWHNGRDAILYNISRVILHEKYYYKSYGRNFSVINDIALIRTATAIVFNKLVAPIALHRGFITNGIGAVTSGWGSSNDNITNLKFLSVTSLTNTECHRRLANLTYDKPIVNFSHLCVFSGRPGHGVCYGDSGGPLVYENKLIGVTSWVHSVQQICAQNMPDGFTRLSLYVDWINNKIESST